MVEFIFFFAYRYPIDWKHPIGYLIAIGLEIVSVFVALHYVTCFLTFAIGCVMISLAVAKDIKDSLILMDENAKSKQYRLHMVERFMELIRFTNLKKLSIKI